MTATELRDALDRLDLTQREAAEALGVSLRTVQSWVGGEHEIPGPAARLVRLWTRHPEIISAVGSEAEVSTGRRS